MRVLNRFIVGTHLCDDCCVEIISGFSIDQSCIERETKSHIN